MGDMDWRDHGSCLDEDPEVFYPKAKRPGSRTHNKEAIKVCQTCPVIAECLDWAYEVNDGWAVLGGMSPRQRAKTRAAWARSKGVAA